MLPDKKSNIVVQKFIINSTFLEREVIVDCYLPNTEMLNNEVNLLIINDGIYVRGLITKSKSMINTIHRILQNAIHRIYYILLHSVIRPRYADVLYYLIKT